MAIIVAARSRQTMGEFLTSCKESRIYEYRIEFMETMFHVPVSKHPDLRHAIPHAAMIPVFGKPHFRDNSVASDHFSATTSESRNLRKLKVLIDSIGSSDSQPL